MYLFTVLVTWAYIIAALTCVAILIATLTYPPQQLFLLHLYDSAAPQEASVGARFTEIMSKFGRPEVYWKIAQYYALSCVVSYFAHSLLISQAVTSFLAAPQRRQDPALEAINQWILNMRDLPKHTLNAIVNYQFTAHQMRLQSIQAHVLYPFVHEIGVKCIIYSAVAAVIAVTAFFRVNTTVELVGSAFQQCVYLYLIRRAYLVAHTPVKELLDALNQQVLNDNYLIGRTLVNNHPQPVRRIASYTLMYMCKYQLFFLLLLFFLLIC